MTMNPLVRLALALPLLLLASILWGKAMPTFTLTEHIGENWTGECVGFPCTLPNELKPSRLAVREANGAVLPAQFIPDAPSSRKGRVFFVVDLPAYGDQHWTLEAAPVAKTDLFLTESGDIVEFGTEKLAVRCPIGKQKWAGGKPAADVPAPILAARLQDGKTWAGTGALHSPLKVTGYTGELLAHGPVVIRLKQTYTFEGGKKFTAQIEAIAGQPVMLVSEQANLNATDHFLEGIRPADAPKGNYTMMAYGDRLYQQGSFWTFTLDNGLLPDRTNQFWGDSELSHDPGPVFSLNPSSGEWWMNNLNWAAFYDSHGDSVLSFMALQAGAWQHPHDNIIVMENDAAGHLRGVMPINNGSRVWGIFADTKSEQTARQEEPPAREYPGIHHPSPAHLACIKYGLLPLDIVKDWTLEFPDPKGTVFPHIYARQDELPLIRQRIAADPEMKANTDRLKRSWDEYRAENDPNFPLIKERIMEPRGIDNIYLATGDESYAKDLALSLLDMMHYYVHQTKEGVGISGYRWSHGYGMFHLTTGPLPIFTREADIALGSPSVTPEQKTQIRALLAFWGELFASRDYFPLGYNHGNTDMVASYYDALAKIASVLNGHPKAKQWAERSGEAFKFILADRWHIPSIEQDEWYGSLSMEMITQGAYCMKRAGLYDLFTDRSYRDGLEYYGKLLVPVDPRYGGGYVVPMGNGQANWLRSAMWAVAAKAVEKDDPAFASRLMWYWERTGKIGTFRYGETDGRGWAALGWIDPSIKAKNPELTTEVLPEWGVIFRNGNGTPNETYLALQVGKPSGLATELNAEGGMLMYAQGMPLCLNFGLRSYDQNMHDGRMNLVQTRWLANRPSFDNRNEMQTMEGAKPGTGLAPADRVVLKKIDDRFETGPTGSLTEFAASSHADLATGQWQFDRLYAYPNPGPNDGPDKLELSKPRPEIPGVRLGHYDWKTVDPITWKRHILFVKDLDPAGPNYFFLRDDAQCKVPWDWNIWSLASDLQVKQDIGDFTGKFGVDLDLVPVTPVPELVTGAYGPTDSFAGYWRQKLYQVQLPGSGEMAAVLYPHKHDQPSPEITAWANGNGAKVVFPDAIHYLFLADAPQQIDQDGIHIDGRAAVVQHKGSALTLTLLSGASVASGEFGLSASPAEAGSVSVTVDTTAKTVTGEAHGPGRTVTLDIQGSDKRTVLLDGKPVNATVTATSIQFALSAGDHRFEVK